MTTFCPTLTPAAHDHDMNLVDMTGSLIRRIGYDIRHGYSELVTVYQNLEKTAVAEHPLFDTSIYRRMRRNLAVTEQRLSSCERSAPLDTTVDDRQALHMFNEYVVWNASRLAQRSDKQWKESITLELDENVPMYRLPEKLRDDNSRTDNVRTLFTILWATDMFGDPVSRTY